VCTAISSCFVHVLFPPIFFIIIIVLLNFFSSPCNFTRSSINASSNGYPLYQRFIHRLYGRHVVFITESACRLYNFWPLHIVHVFVSDIVFNLPPYFKNQSIQDYYIISITHKRTKKLSFVNLEWVLHASLSPLLIIYHPLLLNVPLSLYSASKVSQSGQHFLPESFLTHVNHSSTKYFHSKHR
jgi:hypothetical protein